MNISRIIVAGILASSMAFAQEDAWPEDEQAQEQATEQSEDSTEQASDSAEPQEEPAAQADDAAKPAEPVAQQAEEPKQSEPVDATSTPVEEPRKVSSINSKMGLGLHVDFNYSFLNGLAQDWNMGDEEEAPAGIGFDAHWVHF